MPYLMAIFYILLAIFGTKMFTAIWYVFVHGPVFILQCIVSFFSGKATSKLKEKKAEDTALYKFIDTLNIFDIFSLFFLTCMIIDPNSLPSIVEEDGALMLVGFLFPFFGSFFIHVIIPEKEKERLARGEHIKLYEYLIGQDVDVIEGAIWSTKPVYENVMNKGKPVAEFPKYKITVEELDYYEGKVEAKLSAKGKYKERYNGYWIPAKYLKLKYRDAELIEKYKAWKGKQVRILPDTIWGNYAWEPAYMHSDYPYFAKATKATNDDVEKTYTIFAVEVAKEVVMFRIRDWRCQNSWVLLENVVLCEEEQNDDATTLNTDHNDHNKPDTPC